MEMIRRLHGPAIEHEALEDTADTFYRKAMEERNIQPVGRPSLVDMDFKPGERFWFKITYEIRPEITPGRYTGIAVDKAMHTIGEADVDAEIEHLRRANSTLHEAGRAADDEHVITADIQELDEAGTALIGRKTAGQRFLLSDTTLAREIRDALAGAEPGQTYRARIDAGTEEKPRTLHVAMHVTKVEKVQLPAFDDAFVGTITGGAITNTAEFLAGVKKDLEQYWSEVSERRVGKHRRRDRAHTRIRGAGGDGGSHPRFLPRRPEEPLAHEGTSARLRRGALPHRSAPGGRLAGALDPPEGGDRCEGGDHRHRRGSRPSGGVEAGRTGLPKRKDPWSTATPPH